MLYPDSPTLTLTSLTLEAESRRSLGARESQASEAAVAGIEQALKPDVAGPGNQQVYSLIRRRGGWEQRRP